MEVSISNVVNISVSEPGQGIGEYNTSNLALFTEEVPGVGFGTDGYKIYLEPTDVATDFGTDSKTAQMANAVFSQNPNIKANSGYLVVILLVNEVQQITFPATPVSGSFIFNVNGGATAAIDWDDTASDVQTKIRAIEGCEEVLVTGGIPGGLTINFKGVKGDISLGTITSNTLVDGGAAPVTPAVSQTTAGETLGQAITRSQSIVQYFGLMCTYIMGEAELLAAAAVVQPLPTKIGFAVGNETADIAAVTGKLTKLTLGGFNKMRGLYYRGDTLEISALLMQAAYAGRALSTNFNGSNTTQTMHLKDLATIQPDITINDSVLNTAVLAGADVYCSIQGVPKVFTSGANEFFDNVYNLAWFVGALQVAGFNLFAQTSTKIPQTENGVQQLVSAYTNVCQQAVVNQFLSPGRWTSPSTFGNLQDFYDNIAQRGYYIYTTPLSLQSVASREAREAPLAQIAIKYAGAQQKSNVIVFINK